MKQVLKAAFRGLFGPYEYYNIYQRDLRQPAPAGDGIAVAMTAADMLRSSSSDIRALASYDGTEAKGFGIVDDGNVVCACWYWYGRRYAETRGFWPLEKGDAKLVQITTAGEARGRGLARRLIGESARAMEAEGFQRLFARIWHGHVASERAFEAAGWRRIAAVVTVHPPVLRRQIKFRWPSS